MDETFAILIDSKTRFETGFYYLQSRYYDPAIRRFINADNAISGIGGDFLGYNMFNYCFNNPVNMFDLSGNWY